MKVRQPTTPCHCSECDADHAIYVRFENPLVIQNDGFALCNRCANNLASRLIEIVRNRHREDAHADLERRQRAVEHARHALLPRKEKS